MNETFYISEMLLLSISSYNSVYLSLQYVLLKIADAFDLI